MHIVVTDSGLGGLSICAGIERNLRLEAPPFPVRLTYVNAWPSETFAYNDLPDVGARAEVFDRALGAIAALEPDRIVIACNTLSILYPHTRFSRSPAAPVLGIIDAAVSMFREAMAGAPDAHLVLVGTKTTIESEEHRSRLIAGGVPPTHVTGHHCHGLAGAIEKDPDAARVAELIDSCAAGASAGAPATGPLFLGLCCTHYTYVAERLRTAMAGHAGRDVRVLDPNQRLAEQVAPVRNANGRTPSPAADISVSVISKVGLTDDAVGGIGRLVRSTSPATAAALLSYRRHPELF
jgi:glutamate racemase